MWHKLSEELNCAGVWQYRWPVPQLEWVQDNATYCGPCMHHSITWELLTKPHLLLLVRSANVFHTNAGDVKNMVETVKTAPTWRASNLWNPRVINIIGNTLNLPTGYSTPRDLVCHHPILWTVDLSKKCLSSVFSQSLSVFCNDSVEQIQM